MSTAAAPGVTPHVTTAEYRNWLSLGRALSLLCDGLRPFVEKEMKAMHANLVATCTPPCTCVHRPGRRPNPYHDMAVCSWAFHLDLSHRGRRPNWKQSDSTKWLDPNLGYWEVAKLFMPGMGLGSAAVQGPQNTDVTGLLNLMYWCTQFKVQRDNIDAVREVRNTKWVHVPKLELSDADKRVAFDAIEKLLQDPAFTGEPSVERALHDVIRLKGVSDLQSEEARVLAEFSDVINHENKRIKGELKVLHRKSNRSEKHRRLLEGRLKNVDRAMEELKLKYSAGYRKGQFVGQVQKWAFDGLSSLARSVQGLRRKDVAVWFLMLFLFCCCSVLDRSSCNDGCPTEDASTPFDTKEINFTDYLSTARESFIGRRWLFKELEETFQSTSNRISGVVIVGDPGTGKSALAAQLICSRISSPTIHRHVLGYHMCKYSDKNTQSPGKFVRNLAEMIARRIPEYGIMVANSSFILRTLDRIDCFQDPVGCFEQAVLSPLRTLQNRPSENWYIVLDALDECMAPVGEERHTIVDLINRKLLRFPTWLKLVMTSRNDTNIFAHLNNVKTVVIEPFDNRNLEDISLYLTERLYQEGPLTFFIKQLFGIDSVENTVNLVSALLNKSQGNFLFVKEMLHYWETSKDAQKNPYALPKTLGDIYHGYFERLYDNGRAFQSVRRILEVLVSAFDPMTFEEIFQLLYWQEQSRPTEYEFNNFKVIMKELGHFLRYGVNDRVSVYHLSLGDWLTSEENEGPFFVSRKRGHELFCDFYLDQIKTNGEPGLAKNILPLAQHIAHAGWKERYVKEFQKFPSQTVNSTDIGGNRTLLHLAATIDNEDVLKLLLQHFSCIDCEDVRGITPAFLAAEQGLLNNVKLFLERGARINHKTKSVKSIYEAVVEDKVSKTKHSKSLKGVEEFLYSGFDNLPIEDPVLQSKTTFWGSTMLHAAAQGGHSDVVRFLLENNAFNSSLNGVHLTPLHLAAESGHAAVVKLLYEAGASADQTALHHAAANNRLEVVKYLLQIGVKDSCVRCDGSFYWLSGKKRWRGDEGIVDLAVMGKRSNGSRAIFESDNNNPWTSVLDVGELFDDRHLIRCESALHAAVSSGHEALVELLAAQNHSAIGCHDYTGRTPLHEAVRKNSTVMVRILVNSNAKVEKDCRFWQALEKSAVLGIEGYSHLGVTESLKYDQDVCHCGYTPLHLAARYGLFEVGVDLLLVKKARAEARDCTGATPLHVAACHNKRDFTYLLTHSKVGAKVNRRSHNGSTPLHSAASCGAMEIIDFLLYHGANISETDQSGMTALHYSILHVRPEDSPLRFLVNDSESSGEQPRIVEIDREGRLAGFYEKEGYIKNTFGFRWLDTFIHLALNISSSELNAMDKEGRTALHLAAVNGLADAVNVLIQRGARLDQRDKHGKTALDLAVEEAVVAPMKNPFYLGKSFEDLRHYVRDHAMVVHLLLSSGASFKKCDRKNDSLLHRAITNYQPYIVQVLLLKGASLKCRDHLGRTPLLSYLHNGGRYIDMVLEFFNASVVIKCGKPFNTSLLHLFAYKKPTSECFNCFQKRSYSKDTKQYHEEDGSLTSAIKTMTTKGNVLDTCLDAEGFTALHRAAQGANIVAIKIFLAHDANASVPSPHYGLDALRLAALHRGSNTWWWRIKPEEMFLDSVVASDAVLELLRHARKVENFRIRCDSNKAELTLYHLAASRGLVRVVEELLEKQNLYGLDVNCPNKHGITPMYLAKLYGNRLPEKFHNTWELVVDGIKKHGGELSYPNKEVELYVIHNYIYGHRPGHFELNIEEHIRHFLLEFTRSFDKSVPCQDYKLNFGTEYDLVVMEILNEINTFESLWPETLLVENALKQFERCMRHYLQFIELLNNSLSFKIDFTAPIETFGSILQNYTKKKVTHFFLMWRKEMHFRDCLKDWFYRYWFVLSNKRKLWLMFRRYLDVSREAFAALICSDLDATRKLYSTFTVDYPRPRTRLFSNFVKSRIGVKNQSEDNVTWPLGFLVKLTVGDFAHLNYLKVLNIGMEPETRVHLYTDEMRQVLERGRDAIRRTMNFAKTMWTS